MNQYFHTILKHSGSTASDMPRVKLFYVRYQTDAICMFEVNELNMQLAFVKNQTYDICKVVASNGLSMSLKYIRDDQMFDKITSEFDSDVINIGTIKWLSNYRKLYIHNMRFNRA